MSKQAENLLDTEPSTLQDWLAAKNLRISNYPTHRATSRAISHQDQILSREAFASNTDARGADLVVEALSS